MLDINNLNPQLILWIHQKRIDAISKKIRRLSCFSWVSCLIVYCLSLAIFKLSSIYSYDTNSTTNEILVIMYLLTLLALLTISTTLVTVSCKFLVFSISLSFDNKKKRKKLAAIKGLNILSKLFPFIGLLSAICLRVIERKPIPDYVYLLSIAILLIGYLTLNIIDKFFSDKKSLTLSIKKSRLGLVKIAPKTWAKTRDAYLDTIDTIPDEINRWEKRNLKYVAYLVIAWDLLGFFRYFLKTLISNAIAKLAEGIATRRVSS